MLKKVEFWEKVWYNKIGYLYVPRTDKRVIAVICNFKFDIENGIAVVYKNERFE